MNFLITKFLKDQLNKFTLFTSLKIVFIYYLGILFSFLSILLVIEFNYAFVEAIGVIDVSSLRESYWQNWKHELIGPLIRLNIIGISIFLGGIYISKLLIRPFDEIARNCTFILDHKKSSYRPDTFSNLSLLTRYSEFFFHYIEDCLKEKKFVKRDIPKQFAHIRGPNFEKVFFFHFFLIFFTLAVSTSIVLGVASFNVFEKLNELTLSTIQNSKVLQIFINKQKFLFNIYISGTIISQFILYIMLILNLYRKVSVASFGIFSTFRSFMKGQKQNRVHLIGHIYLRPQARMINKFLEELPKLINNSSALNSNYSQDD